MTPPLKNGLIDINIMIDILKIQESFIDNIVAKSYLTMKTNLKKSNFIRRNGVLRSKKYTYENRLKSLLVQLK